jgi:MOSC domain-containing protein YiiM
MDGVVEFVAIGAAAGEAMELHDRATASAGKGLDGDRYGSGAGFFSDAPGGGRDLTLCEAEALDAVLAEHQIRLGPAEHRRNLTTRGIDLNNLVGKRFMVGEVLCEGVRLCEPCEHLVELAGKDVLAPLLHRAGLRANLLSSGVIRIGDRIAELETSSTTGAARASSQSGAL